MAAVTPTRITLLARVNDSEVLNEIATVEVDTEWRLGVPSNGAVDAVGTVTVNLAAILREAADRLDGS